MNWPYLKQRKKCDESNDVNECKMCSCHCTDAFDKVGGCTPKGDAPMGFVCP